MQALESIVADGELRGALGVPTALAIVPTDSNRE
jgi:hypothetical protein